MLIINKKYMYLLTIILIQFNSSYSEGIKCVQCSDCNTNKLEPTPCENENVEKCFTQIDASGKIIRGCGTTQDPENCTKEKNCIITDSGKNNQLICKKCETSDEKCSQTDMKLNDLKYNEICDEGVDSCLMKVDNKLVMRGCNSGKIECGADDNTCKTCTEDNCNIGIFPTKRINCYQCSGSNCLDIATNTELTKPCVNYEADDKCYILGKSETDMVRGCRSDAKNNQCSNTADGCLFCSTDNCNNLKYKYDQKLKCHQCESSNPTNDCFMEQTGKELKNCQKQILYNAQEYCYARVKNGAIQRGCLHDNDQVTLENCSDNEECTKCNNVDGCNSKAMTTKFTCISCRSDVDENCRDNADKFEGKECRTAESSPNDGCFTGIWNGVVIRGCLVDASIQDQEICKDKQNIQCRLCQGSNNCNKENTSGANKVGIQSVLFLVISISLWNFK